MEGIGHDEGGWRRKAGRAAGGRDEWVRLLSATTTLAVVFHAALFLVEPELDTAYEPARPFSNLTALVATPIVSIRSDSDERLRAAAPEAPDPTPVTPNRPPIPPPPIFAVPLEALAEVPMLPEIPERLIPPGPPPTTPVVKDEWETYRVAGPAVVPPEVRNRAEVRRFLERRYQPIARRVGTTGQVVLRFWIDEEGVAKRVAVATSSGYAQLDEIALSLKEMIRFRAAAYGGVPTRVVVDVPISFRTLAPAF
jgi:TonB family protein